MSINRPEKAKAEMQQVFEQLWEEVHQWRAAHPEASFDEIAAASDAETASVDGTIAGALGLSA